MTLQSKPNLTLAVCQTYDYYFYYIIQSWDTKTYIRGTRLAESGVRWQIVSRMILYGIRIAKIKIELIISFPNS